jgi:hypothetical protein
MVFQCETFFFGPPCGRFSDVKVVGFSIDKYILTNALIGMASFKDRDTLSSIEEFNIVLEHISDLLERMNDVNPGNSQSAESSGCCT